VSSANDNVAIVGESLARGLFSLCGSPIEESLLATLICLNGQDVFKPVFGKAGVVAQCKDWLLMCQHPFEQYRLDFAIVSNAGKIAVECDGHEYHERTREQAMHDRSRDRKCQLAGWKVLRFTGSEIHRDVRVCVKQVLQMMAMADGCLVEDYLPKPKPLPKPVSLTSETAPDVSTRYALAILGALLDFPNLTEEEVGMSSAKLLTNEFAEAVGVIVSSLLEPMPVDAGYFVAKMPISLQSFCTNRLASPVFDKIEEGRANLCDLATYLERLHERRQLAAMGPILDNDAGMEMLKKVTASARKRNGIGQ